MLQLTTGIYQLPLGPVNAFIIEDKGLTLIDTGYRNNLDKIFNALAKAGKDPHDIRQIILTHCHPDHAGSAAAIKKQLQVPLYAHREETPLIEQGIPGRHPLYCSPGPMNWLVFNLFVRRSSKQNEPVAVEEKLDDNDVLPILSGIQVIHTPGHSAGHISLWVKNEGVLIAADICSNMGTLGLSTVYENRQLGIESILKAAAFDFDKAVFGHGKPIYAAANTRLKEKFGKKKEG